MKWIKLLSIAFLASTLFTVPSYGQEVKKKVKIVTKKTDANGNEVVEEKYAEGEDAEKLLEEMDIDVVGDGKIRVEIETDENGKTRKTVRVEDTRIKKGGEEEIKIDVDRDGENGFTLRMNRDGEEDVFHWEGLENLPGDLERMLEDLDVKLHLDEMDFGDLELGDMGDFEMKGFNFPSMGRAALGVRVEDSEAMDGAKIIEVSEGSAAEAADLREGDIITAINGIPIEEVGDLIRKIAKYEPQERIEVEYERNGNSKTAKVKLKERTY